jgi:pimeloyl-ACP methyl ester carboxylesterase
VDVGGLSIAVEDAGDPTRIPLLMVHGFTGHRDDFAGVREALASDRRVLVPDLPGHGDSGRTGRVDDYTFARAVAGLVALLDVLGVERAHLLGHSMGGMLALRLVLAHPGRVVSLVAMSTAPDAPANVRGDALARPAAFAREAGMSALQEKVERRARQQSDPVRARWAETYWRHHRRRYRAMDPAAYAGFAHAMGHQEPVTSRLGEIRCPTLVIVGEADAAFLPGAAALERGIPGARRVTLPDAGHHPHQEARQAWLAVVRTHLAQCDPVHAGDVASAQGGTGSRSGRA